MLKSVDQLLFFVKSPNASEEFYKKLGFTTSYEGHGNHFVRASLGNFEILCHDETKTEIRGDAFMLPKGSGVYIYLRVQEIDKYYNVVLKRGLKPSSPPKNWPWGNREFAIKDPDGYKLVFYEKV